VKTVNNNIPISNAPVIYVGIGTISGIQLTLRALILNPDSRIKVSTSPSIPSRIAWGLIIHREQFVNEAVSPPENKRIHHTQSQSSDDNRGDFVEKQVTANL
jgi:hypothetical protein